MVLKAELHCHLEGAAHPDLVLQKARKYGVDVCEIISENSTYIWQDFTSFIKAYDLSASLFRTQQDYSDLAFDMYDRLAKQNCIYGEVFISPDHAATVGMSCDDLVAAVGDGILLANKKHGIEGRMIIIGVRHEGVDAVEKAARQATECQHPLMTGFGIAGDERFGEPKDFAKAFQIAKDANLGLTGHAGELCGSESVRHALDHWNITRVGHGVRAIEDPDLVKRLAEEKIVMETCPGSNISLGVFESYDRHPFPKLYEAGCVLTLNSDDPPYFDTDLANEYKTAATDFHFSEEALLGFTKNAINAAFVDEETRARLLQKCN